MCSRRRQRVFALALAALLGASSHAAAQRRPGGGAGISRPGGGAGISRPGGGAGISRPGGVPGALPGGISGNRPNLPSARPSPLPGSRPSLGNMVGNRPGGIGGNTRPSLPGGIGGGGITRPGGPSTLPGGIGGNTRPSLPGGIGGGDRPSIGNRPSIPGIGNRPSLPGEIGRPGIGNRPGGGFDRPSIGDITRPSFPGIGDRPGIGTRPSFPGVGDRPGIGTRPSFPGVGDRPGGGGGNWWGNRPGGGNWGNGNWGEGSWGNGGWGNSGWGGNRPGGNWGNGSWGNSNNWSNNNNWNNWTNNNWNINNNNVVINNGGWGGGWGGNSWGWGGGWGGNPWGWGGGWGGNPWGWGGGWNGGGFWAGLGTGLIGGALFNNMFIPSMAVAPVFPTWTMGTYAGWGMGGLASDWMFASYANPFLTQQTQTIIVQQPVVVAGAQPVAGPVVAWDYSQPINVAAMPPEPSAAESAQTVFNAALDTFKAGDYPGAQAKVEQAMALSGGNVPLLHEFRALTLFAQKRFDEAASAIYATLSAGPGWDWATLVGLYPNVETYTDQQRALEAYVRENPKSASGQFLLAYHYLVQEHREAARSRFEAFEKIKPGDPLVASFLKALKPVETPQPAAVAASGTETPPAGALPSGDAQVQAQAAASDETPKEPPPPPPAALVGTWTAQPAPKVSISLTLKQDGAFTWAVTDNGKTQSIEGLAGFDETEKVLALFQQQGEPLAGKVTLDPTNPAEFGFLPVGAPEQARLAFKKNS